MEHAIAEGLPTSELGGRESYKDRREIVVLGRVLSGSWASSRTASLRQIGRVRSRE